MRRAHPSKATAHKAPRCTARRGFTLIELLVAITILLILATMTFTLFNASMKGDQIRTAARQIQSYVEGARDRALHARADRGVRFLRDPNNPATINAMLFIQAQDPEEGTLILDATDKRTVTNPLGWDELVEKGLLSTNGAYISLTFAGQTFLYSIRQETVMMTTSWKLSRQLVGGASYTAGTTIPYKLYLPPAVMPNQEPRLLPASILVDLNHSRYPAAWRTTPDNMDIMFSPRGTVSGSISSVGNIHLLLADVRDIERNLGAFDVDLNANSTIDQNEKHLGETLVVSITTQTGKVTSHPVYYDVNDPFRYAESGDEAP
ncbi:MAG: prepilin-type N-terminal cleavage/methylation domain-containing protein [Planctomycetaceae bacterium]|nr:prepilin-type N-terminal cleavage/methylation domain-containing protein [Planctomycetaceae bacterium]